MFQLQNTKEKLQYWIKYVSWSDIFGSSDHRSFGTQKNDYILSKSWRPRARFVWFTVWLLAAILTDVTHLY